MNNKTEIEEVETFVCDGCDSEEVGEGTTMGFSGRYIVCDYCYAEMDDCSECHGLVLSDDLTDGLCSKCEAKENTCSYCSETSVRSISGVDWDNGYKSATLTRFCEEHDAEYNPELDVEAIADRLGETAEKKEEIRQIIQNNINTRGTAWKLMLEGDDYECRQALQMMEAARSRHEDTDYDALLAKGFSKESAREYIQ
jgi:hypothetical protein